MSMMRKERYITDVPSQERGDHLSEDTTNSRPLVPGRYLSLVIHLWVGEDGELLRGTIEDAHTGKRLGIDLSALAALLRQSLAQAPGQQANAQDGGAMTGE